MSGRHQIGGHCCGFSTSYRPIKPTNKFLLVVLRPALPQILFIVDSDFFSPKRHWLVFVMETRCVFFKVRTEFLTVVVCCI
jgi:hypothetical protein